jgi:hypothetical protein
MVNHPSSILLLIIIIIIITTTTTTTTTTYDVHVRWVPCHHCMARPQISYGGEGLQIWRAAANILNKQSRTADERLSCSLRLGVGLTTPRCKNVACYEMSQSVWEDNIKMDLKEIEIDGANWITLAQDRAGDGL